MKKQLQEMVFNPCNWGSTCCPRCGVVCELHTVDTSHINKFGASDFLGPHATATATSTTTDYYYYYHYRCNYNNHYYGYHYHYR